MAKPEKTAATLEDLFKSEIEAGGLEPTEDETDTRLAKALENVPAEALEKALKKKKGATTIVSENEANMAGGGGANKNTPVRGNKGAQAASPALPGSHALHKGDDMSTGEDDGDDGSDVSKAVVEEDKPVFGQPRLVKGLSGPYVSYTTGGMDDIIAKACEGGMLGEGGIVMEPIGRPAGTDRR